MAYQAPALPANGIVQSSDDVLRMLAEDDGSGGLQMKVGAVIETGDIEIGAVELKNGATDARAIINPANTGRNATDNVLLTQQIDDVGNTIKNAVRYSDYTPTPLSASGTTTPFDNQNIGCEMGSVQYVVAGGPSALSLQFEASNDASNYVSLGSPGTSLTGGALTFSDAPFKWYRLNLGTLTTTNKAQGTITISGGVPLLDETFQIGAQIFTWKAVRGGVGEVELGANEAACVTNIVTALGLDLAGVVTSADGTGDTVVVTSVATGAAGNAIVFTENCTNVTMDGAGFLGGTTLGVDPTVSFYGFFRT